MDWPQLWRLQSRLHESSEGHDSDSRFAVPAVMHSIVIVMVDDAALHPYGALGAKGVLEHLAVSIADEFATRLRQSRIENIDKGIRFISSHGVLDIEHVRLGDESIRSIRSPANLEQILDGAIVTREAYHGFINGMEDLSTASGRRGGLRKEPAPRSADCTSTPACIASFAAGRGPRRLAASSCIVCNR